MEPDILEGKLEALPPRKGDYGWGDIIAYCFVGAMTFLTFRMIWYLIMLGSQGKVHP